MTRSFPLQRECLAFGISVAHFSGRRGIAAALLVALGAALEGLGILLLIPLLTTVFDAPMPAGGSLLSWLSGWIPPDLGPLQRLMFLLALFSALMLLRAFILWRRDSLLGDLQVGFVADQRALLARRLGAARWPMLVQLGHARVTHLMAGDIQRIGIGVQFVFQSTVATVVVAGQILVAFVLSPALAMIALALMLFGATAMLTLLQKSSDVGGLVTHANLSLMTLVGQFLGGIKVAMSQNIQLHFVERFERELAITADQQARFIQQQALLRGLWSLLGAGMGGATILTGFGLLDLPAPVLIAMLIILVRISGPASQIQLGMQHIAYSLAAWEAVKAMDRELAGAASSPASGSGIKWPHGSIDLENVVFRHPGSVAGEDAGLAQVSLTIEPGEILGVQGASGAGKTTLADLLCGLRAPQSGRVVIAGVALTEENAPDWQNCVAYIAQDPVLFNESVRENLLWANPQDAAAIAAALALVGADRMIARLPHGLDTIVGERGSLISGGERQRLALARALLRKPALLILDEATNAIDLAGEAEILMHLRALSLRPAVLMIAHRRESLRFCDRVVHLEKGRLMATTVGAPPTIEPSSQRAAGITSKPRIGVIAAAFDAPATPFPIGIEADSSLSIRGSMSFVGRFAQLAWKDRLLLGDAMLCLMIASLLISLLSFRSVARFMTSGRKTVCPAPPPQARRISWALNACGNRVPWRAVCFQRGVAAQMMLRRRGWSAVINYGIRRYDDGALAAHVWARSGDVDVIGCEIAAEFQLVTSFEAGASPS